MPRRETAAAKKARLELYDRILASARLLAAAHPERLQDKRGLEGLERFFEWLGVVFGILDEYSIQTPRTVADRSAALDACLTEVRRLRDDCGNLRLKLEGRDLGNGGEEPGEDP